MKFHHIALNCIDLKETEAFYLKHFGFEVKRRLPIGNGQEIVFIGRDDVNLELFETEEVGTQGKSDGPSLSAAVRHFGFQVENVDGVLVAMGDEVEVTLGPLDFDSFIPGWRTAWFRDPNGYIIEISQGFSS